MLQFMRGNILLAILMGLVMSFLSHAVDNVSINFTGTIRAATCDVGTGSDGQTVILGDVGTQMFGNPGDVSSAKPFAIMLDCPVGGPDNASITFNGTPSTDSSLLALDSGSGVASGVAVRINENDGTKIALDTASATTVLASGENTLHYTAQYQALVSRSLIMAGTANSTAQFTINYP